MSISLPQDVPSQAGLLRCRQSVSDGGAITDLMQQLGHRELATTQRYAAGLSERRRATVMAMDFTVSAATKTRTKRSA